MRVIVYGFGNRGGYGALLNVDQATGAPISERKRRLLYDAITYVFHWSYTNDAWDRRMEELSDDGATSDDGQELDFDFLVGDTREVRVWPFLIKGCVADIAPPLLLEEGKRINVIIVAVGIDPVTLVAEVPPDDYDGFDIETCTGYGLGGLRDGVPRGFRAP